MDCNFLPKELHSRFLYPFFFNPDRLSEAADALVNLTHVARSGSVTVWEAVTEPHEFYRQEALGAVETFLFPQEANRSVRCCRYFKVTSGRLSAWFRKGIQVREIGRNPKNGSKQFPARLFPDLGIELFLSPHGVGVLSISLMADDTVLCNTLRPAQGIAASSAPELDALKQFNYRLSQLREATAPTLFIDRSPNAIGADPSSMSAPDHDAPFLDRLGKAGGEFTLKELITHLLSPLDSPAFGFESAQSQLSVYTVVRFGEEVDFADSAVRHRLGPLLAGLAQIEEAAHAGAPPDTIAIANEILNTRHWAAVSAQGAAHLVADQPSSGDPPRPHPFNVQRLPVVRQKYFVPYLMALFQRLTLHRSIKAAGGLVRSQHWERHAGFRRLHEDLLEFTVCGYFTEVSGREAVNRFYRLAQKGLGVERTQEVISGAIREYDVAKIVGDVNHNVHNVAAIQQKVEWLEVFFASFYATELVHIIAEGFFTADYAHASVLVWPILAGVLAAWGLKPWDAAHDASKGRWRVILALATTAALIWLALGFFGFYPPEKSAANQHAHPSLDQDRDAG